MDQNIDYRQFIRSAISEKSARNPAYSMRAFAKKVGLSASHLSRVLSGEKDLSLEAAFKVAVEMGLIDDQIEQFLDRVAYQTADDSTKEILRKRIQKKKASLPRRTLALEVFKVISDWHNLPIFELIKAKPFQTSESWLARKLGLSILEIKAALDRLEFVGLVRKETKGLVAIEGSELQTTDDVASTAIRKHHEQMSNKAVEALSQPVKQREFQSLQLVFNPNDTATAQKRIREFVSSFEEEFKSKKSDEVYQMNVQFFSLTRKIPKEET